ncbi:hypothetical protein CMUS01_09449 [Colletotrichum musicola]|uniref:UDP-galactose transporter n=1 Tax=Colletotrichum musicola TaxID=2175873 RepID=A0A8H6K7E5_9PEZI|nr:hypothetical protein CMUS01_09449 [Colletotrichum musicola]
MAVTRSTLRRALALVGPGSGPGLALCLAALGLVALQVGAAANLWNARDRGQFDFSPSSALAISELLRSLVAALLFRCEARRGAAGDAGYSSLGASDDVDLGGDSEEDGPGFFGEKASAYARVGGVRALWRFVFGQAGAEVRFAFAKIALLQMLANNLLFLNYLVVDPGTIQLTKSGIAIGAALFATPAFGLKGPKTRWMAFVIQTCGLIISQFLPQHRTRASTYQMHLYLVLVGQAGFSSLSDIHCEKLLRGTELSANASNVVLGGFGALLNLLVHALVRYASPLEPGFLSGYDGKGLSVVLFTTVLGLYSTFASKHIDSWARWFTMDITTIILLSVSAAYYKAKYSSFVIPGTVLIFIASLAYLKYSPVKDYAALSPTEEGRPSLSTGPSKQKLRISLLTLASFLGACIVPFATVAEPPHTPEYRLVMRDDTDGHCLTPPADILRPFTDRDEPYKVSTGEGNLTASPFSNTLAMIRWNAKRTERIPLLLKYQPFFHTVHVSMPEVMPDKPEDYHNLTHSQYGHHETVYMQVAHTMKLILDEQPEIEGLFYFHFDSWIDPLAWADENRESMWFPTSHNTRQFEGDGPRYMCMTDWQKFPQWWGWYHKWNEKAVTVNGEILRLNRGYDVVEDEFCVGWSDIFYVPRRFFADFIFLSYVYGCADLFHEVAIPTMLNIIDRSRRSSAAKHQPLIDRIGDCWGGCCDDSATAHDVKWTRCGHRLDYLKQELVDAHYGRLDEQAAWLGQSQRKTAASRRG